jgi:hypothetical protein
MEQISLTGSELYRNGAFTGEDEEDWGDLDEISAVCGTPVTPDPPEPPIRADSTLESFNFENGEAMLVRELNNMSVEERERILHDVHGVEDEAETPDLIKDSLEALNASIEATKQTANADAYLLAESICPAFVQNDKFRLLFLRSMRFDVEKATVSLFSHFEKKQELFGLDTLCEDISLDDLNEDDMRTLKNGQTQLLPDRDRSGRAIFFQAHSHMVFRDHENVVSQRFRVHTYDFDPLFFRLMDLTFSSAPCITFI